MTRRSSFARLIGRIVLAALASCAAPAVGLAQDRVGISVSGNLSDVDEVSASLRAAFAARGVHLVPADEMRAAIHFTAPSGTPDEEQAGLLVAQLALRGLFVVVVEPGDEGRLLLRVRLVRAEGTATRFGEVSRDALPEWIAGLVNEVVGHVPSTLAESRPPPVPPPPVAPPPSPTPVIATVRGPTATPARPIDTAVPAPPAPSSVPAPGATISVDNRGSASLCRAAARHGDVEVAENVLEQEIAPRAEQVRIAVPSPADRLSFYTCAGQRVATIDVRDGDATQIDYQEVNHAPVFLRLGVEVVAHNTWVPSIGANFVGLGPTVAISFGYALEPGGLGLGAIVRLGADIGCYAGNCAGDFGGSFLAGLSMPGGVFGLGARVSGSAASFLLGSEVVFVRITNEFGLTGGYEIGLGSAGAFALTYGVALGFGGTLY